MDDDCDFSTGPDAEMVPEAGDEGDKDDEDEGDKMRRMKVIKMRRMALTDTEDSYVWNNAGQGSTESECVCDMHFP